MKKLILLMFFALSFNKVCYAQQEPVRFMIVFADWDEWGRTSKECASWGLCNFRSCTFCCVQEGTIVDCPTKSRMPNSGTIKIDTLTNKGFLYIELDPLFDIQKLAIDKKEIFYIDDDLSNKEFIIKKGQYPFNSSIGKYGGYKIDATKIK
jgi:hypothetical protein